MKTSDENCELILEGFGGIEKYKALRIRGMDLGRRDKVLDNYIELLEFVIRKNESQSKFRIMKDMDIKLGKFDRLLSIFNKKKKK